MSVDIYVSIPAAEWPTTQAVEQCLRSQSYPLQIKRFPTINKKSVTTDGILATLDGKEDAYLEGEVSPAELVVDEMKDINGRIGSTGGSFRVGRNDILISIRTRAPSEARAADYLIASFIVCFHGYGFEPQGNTHGRSDFARTLVSEAEALKGL